MMPTPLDLALQAVVPVLPVPLHGNFVPLNNNGQRFLLAADGLYIEVKRDWLHAIWPIADERRVAKPFGTIESGVRFEFGSVPVWVKERFAADAANAGDLEIAACVVWNNVSKELEYIRCQALAASSSRIEYVRPPLGAHQSLVIDLHSHGHGPAFFSLTDDMDDRNEVKISGVIGEVNKDPSWKFRLCLSGIFIPQGVDARKNEIPSDSEAGHA